MPFYEKGDVRIHYEEAGGGFPLLLIPGGGLNSDISYLTGFPPFNAMEVLSTEYRCITMDLRNAPDGQSTGPLEIDQRKSTQRTIAGKVSLSTSRSP